MEITGRTALVKVRTGAWDTLLQRRCCRREPRRSMPVRAIPSTVSNPRLTPVHLDVTSPADVAAATGAYADTEILVNDVGIFGDLRLSSPHSAQTYCQNYKNGNIGDQKSDQTEHQPVE